MQNNVKTRKHRTHEQYVEELKELRPNIEIIDTFINMVTKVKHRCKVCGHEWSPTPHDMLSKNKGNCPNCSKMRAAEKLKRQRYKIGESIIDNNRNITIIDVKHEAKSNGHKIWFYKYKCNKCGFDCGEHYKNGVKYVDYWTTQDNILRGKGCACCSNRIIVPYINSILSQQNDYGWILEYFPNPEDASKYPLNYSKKLLLQCPDCKRTKMISPHTIQCCGFGCVCGDGFSYPEKFMFNILDQLNIQFEHGKKFLWSQQTEKGTKIYDFYLSQYNMIIETHGLQHYESVFDYSLKRTRSFEQERENDLFKKQLTIDNGVKYYIELNCSESNKEFIYKSIIDSNILTILQINQSEIDIDLADQFATSNIIKQCAKLWEDGATTIEISNTFKIHRTTVRRYLRKANELGWCKYGRNA